MQKLTIISSSEYPFYKKCIQEKPDVSFELQIYIISICGSCHCNSYLNSAFLPLCKYNVTCDHTYLVVPVSAEVNTPALFASYVFIEQL